VSSAASAHASAAHPVRIRSRDRAAESRSEHGRVDVRAKLPHSTRFGVSSGHTRDDDRPKRTTRTAQSIGESPRRHLPWPRMTGVTNVERTVGRPTSRTPEDRLRGTTPRRSRRP
jgi:hypothetical protein